MPAPEVPDREVVAKVGVQRDGILLGDGATAPGQVELNGSPGPIVVAVHGLGGYGEDYRYLIEDFVAHRLSVVALDLRGFGRWPEPRGDLRNVGIWLVDLRDVVVSLRRRYPERPVILLGESMGAAVALWYQQAFADDPLAAVDGLVGFSLVADPQVRLPIAKYVEIGFAYTFAPRKRIGLDPEPALVSRDAAFQARLASDPNVVRAASFRLLAQIKDVVDRQPNLLGAVDVPFLIVQPGDDIFSSPGGRNRLRSLAPQADFRLMADCKHAMINDLCRGELFRATRQWLERQ